MGHRLLLTAWVLRQLLRQLFLLHPAPKPYADRQWKPRSSDVFDLPTAIVLRLSGGFASVVEIGAGGGDRIAAVKKARPEITATAMDIGADCGRCVEGVTFVRYALDQIAPSSLVFCVGTLNCMSEQEVADFFESISASACTLVAFEPRPPYRHARALRRSKASWYHTYEAIAAKSGLTDRSPLEARWSHVGSLKNFEQWRPMLFTGRPQTSCSGRPAE